LSTIATYLATQVHVHAPHLWDKIACQLCAVWLMQLLTLRPVSLALGPVYLTLRPVSLALGPLSLTLGPVSLRFSTV